MLKRYSALDENYIVGKYPVKKKINLKFKEHKNLLLQQLSFWPKSFIESLNFIKNELNSDQIPDFNKGSVFTDHSLWRMEPFKFWLLGKQLNLPEELGTDLDLSQAFTCIEITGEDIPLFLNRHLPVDLRENVFVFPASASSAIHHVSVKLLKFSIDKYYLFIPRGFALSIWEILLETSKQFGYEILDR